MEPDWKLIFAQGETMNVDFKGPMSWEGTARADVAEDIVAMANVRDGGLILIGVSEGIDGRAVVDGLSAEQLATFDPTKVCDYVASYFQPAVRLRVERYDIEGKVVAAIRVAEFETTPIICVKDGPEKRSDTGRPKRAFYAGHLVVRTPAAKSEQIRTADDMQALIRLAVTKTTDALLTDVRRIIEGGGGSPAQPAASPFERERAMWSEGLQQWRAAVGDVGSFSIALFPESPLDAPLDHVGLRKVVADAHVSKIGFEFPHCSEDQYTTIQNRPGAIQGNLVLGGFQEIWQLHASGAFMFTGALREDVDARLRQLASIGSGERFLDFVRAIWLIGLGVLFARRLYEQLQPGGVIRYEVTFDGMRGRRLVGLQPGRDLRSVRRTVEPRIESSGRVTVLDLRSGWRQVVHRIVREVFALFNFDIDPSVIDGDLDALEGRRQGR